MANQNIVTKDSGYRGNSIYKNYKVRCSLCKQQRTVYWMYADEKHRDLIRSGKFENKKHDCPACRVKRGARSTVSVIRNLTAQESHYRLEKHKLRSQAISLRDIDAFERSEEKLEHEYQNDQEKMEWMMDRAENGKAVF